MNEERIPQESRHLPRVNATLQVLKRISHRHKESQTVWQRHCISVTVCAHEHQVLEFLGTVGRLVPIRLVIITGCIRSRCGDQVTQPDQTCCRNATALAEDSPPGTNSALDSRVKEQVQGRHDRGPATTAVEVDRDLLGDVSRLDPGLARLKRSLVGGDPCSTFDRTVDVHDQVFRRFEIAHDQTVVRPRVTD